MGGATVDTVLATAVATPASAMDLDMVATATLVLEVTTASVRLRPSLRLKLRLIPTTDTDTLDSTLARGATEDMDTVLAIAVATPLLDMLDLDTAVDTTEDSTMAVATMESVRLRLRPRLIPTTVMVTLDSTVATDLDTAVATPLLDTLVLATAVATTDTDTVTAVATDSMVRFTEPKEKRNRRRSANP